MVELKDKKVGIGDCKIAIKDERLVTIGLGSCVGISLIDKNKGIGALIHILLPDSTRFKEVTNPYKYADLAIPMAINELIKLGCRKNALKAKIAGGASMFDFGEKSISMNIGESNVVAVKKALTLQNIYIEAEEVGGKRGRSMYVFPKDNKVEIKIVGGIIKEI